MALPCLFAGFGFAASLLADFDVIAEDSAFA
jgi:hypothetical protein